DLSQSGPRAGRGKHAAAVAHGSPDGARVRNAGEWYKSRRPELMKQWTAILGKIAPAPEDMKWFGDVRKAVLRSRADREGYTRIELDLPIEKDFLQPH